MHLREGEEPSRVPEHGGFARSGWGEEGNRDPADPNPLLKSSPLTFPAALEATRAKQNHSLSPAPEQTAAAFHLACPRSCLERSCEAGGGSGG